MIGWVCYVVTGVMIGCFVNGYAVRVADPGHWKQAKMMVKLIALPFIMGIVWPFALAYQLGWLVAAHHIAKEANKETGNAEKAK